VTVDRLRLPGGRKALLQAAACLLTRACLAVLCVNAKTVMPLVVSGHNAAIIWTVGVLSCSVSYGTSGGTTSWC
jgi:hypothetical protein